MHYVYWLSCVRLLSLIRKIDRALFTFWLYIIVPQALCNSHIHSLYIYFSVQIFVIFSSFTRWNLYLFCTYLITFFSVSMFFSSVVPVFTCALCDQQTKKNALFFFCAPLWKNVMCAFFQRLPSTINIILCRYRYVHTRIFFSRSCVQINAILQSYSVVFFVIFITHILHLVLFFGYKKIFSFLFIHMNFFFFSFSLLFCHISFIVAFIFIFSHFQNKNYNQE